MLVFLDTEFTNLQSPELLSIGLVSLDGREHYVELDLQSEIGKARVKASSDFVRWGGVLDCWGLVANAEATAWEMGRRTGDWLLSLAQESGRRVEVAFDYMADFELLEHAIRDAGTWEWVRDVVLPVNIDAITCSVHAELAADECFRSLRKRGLHRHHALADALALRAAYVCIKDSAVRVAAVTQTIDFRRLVDVATGAVGQSGADGSGAGETAAWLQQWLTSSNSSLGGRRPIEVLEEADGLGRVEKALLAIARRVNG